MSRVHPLQTLVVPPVDLDPPAPQHNQDHPHQTATGQVLTFTNICHSVKPKATVASAAKRWASSRSTSLSRTRLLPPSSRSISLQPSADEATFITASPLPTVQSRVLTPTVCHTLKGVSGRALPGQLTALAGKSGAGKSTLLDVLSGTITQLDAGVVCVNDAPVDQNHSMRSGYVPQEDNLFPALTVTETLTYAGRFRVQDFHPSQVTELIKALGLQACAHSRVGDERTRGVSGGERKRVSIGQELIRNPGILFLDEPTSGLDSQTALLIISVLYEIARTKQTTVVLTIHQPSARLLSMLSHIIILSAGYTVFAGPPTNLKPYFEAVSGAPARYPCNGLEFALDVIHDMTDKAAPELGARPLIEAFQQHNSNAAVDTEGADNNTKRSGCRGSGVSSGGEHVGALLDAASASAHGGLRLPPLGRVSHNDIQEPMQLQRPSVRFSIILHGVAATIDGFRYTNTIAQEVSILIGRSLVIASRTKELFATRLVSFVVLGLLVGTFFFNPGTSAYAAEAIRSYSAYTMMVFFFTSVEALPIIIRDRPTFLREISRGSYRLISLALSDFAVSVAFFTVLSVAYTLICFWLIGITGAEKFFFQVFHLFTMLLAGSAFVLLVSALVPHFTAANAASLALFAIMFLASGSFTTRSQIQDHSPWYLWTYYMSMFRYGNDGFVGNLIEKTGPYDCPVSCQSTSELAIGCSLSSEFMLSEVFGIVHMSKWADSAILLLYVVAFQLMYLWVMARACAQQNR